MGRHLDVSLSGYYSWKDRKEQRQKEVDEYKKMIKTIFQESNGTYAATDLLNEAVGFKPETPIEEGLQRFADWYVEYYQVK